MNVVDSSGWLEYFSDAPNADFFAPVIENTDDLVVPTISIFEVFKKILQQREGSDALQAIAIMKQGLVVELDTNMALNAATVSTQYNLPMADSIILATAQTYQATLWTQDADFKGIEGVAYVEK